jgi:uncharacterized protein YaeQ
MALKSTVFKARLNISDLDRNIYEDFSLSVARHPSETDARMMLRIVAYALHADPQLEFGRGISTDDEPDLWRRDLTGVIELWIDLGIPDPGRLRKACGRAQQVVLYAYGERAYSVWREKHARELSRPDNLAIYAIDDRTFAALGVMASPGMALQCTVSEGDVWLTDDRASIEIKPRS